MSRDVALVRLQGLLESCRVRVDGQTRGTGFFVAPRWIVTCAHVSGSTVGAQVPIQWHRTPLIGVIRAASATPKGARETWPFPDLALVEVADAPDGHPCVLLDETQPPQGTALTVAGFSDIYEPGVLSERTAVFAVSGRTGIRGGVALELVGNEVNHGLSGGAVLSAHSGGVCAIVKATRMSETPLGGVGVPVDSLRLLDAAVYRAVIRAHDRFHENDHRWVDLSDSAAASENGNAIPRVMPRSERLSLLALLAALQAEPTAQVLCAAFESAAPDAIPSDTYPLVDYRDVFTDLAALLPPDSGCIPYELRFAAELAARHQESRANDSVAQQLRDQVLIAASGLGLGARVRELLVSTRESQVRPGIIARLRHSGRDRALYRVMAWRYYAADRVLPTPESPELPLPDAMAHLQSVLREQIEIMGGVSMPALVELILPVEALDEKFSHWKLWPEEEWFTLGRKQFVVVRPLERHNVPRFQAAWTDRWNHLDGKNVGEILVCVCGRDSQYNAALGAAFDLDPSLAALVLAGSPCSGAASQAYRVAVASGIPMIVWRRKAPLCARADGQMCGLPGTHDCPGDTFFAAVRDALCDTSRDTVPERVRQLRNAAENCDGTERVGEDIVVLWDDPLRQIPRLAYTPAPEGATQ